MIINHENMCTYAVPKGTDQKYEWEHLGQDM